jgi:hypothetical protein
MHLKGTRKELDKLLECSAEGQKKRKKWAAEHPPISPKENVTSHRKDQPNWDRIVAVAAALMGILAYIYLRDRNSLIFASLALCGGLIWIVLHLLKTVCGSKNIWLQMLAITVCMAVVAYVEYTQRPEMPKPLVFTAFQSLDRPEGDSYAGIIWDARFHDVRLIIENQNNYPVKDIDLTVSVDPNKGDLAGMGQVSDFPGVTFSVPPWPDTSIIIRGKDGREYRLPSGDIKSGRYSPTYIMSCITLRANSQLRLVVAAISGADGGVPEKFTLSGSYEAISGDVDKRVLINQVVYLQR